MDGKQIIELAKICARIEKHYKKPQDIEWAYKPKKAIILTKGFWGEMKVGSYLIKFIPMWYLYDTI